MSNFYNQASWVLVPSGIEEDIVFAQKPISGLGDLTFTRASDATYTDSTGVVRRSPYNLLQQSNTFNVTWGAAFATVTIGQGGYDGTNNAWLFSKSLADGRISQNITLTSGAYTYSVYAKAGTKNWVFLRIDGTSNRTAYFDLQTGVTGTASGCTSSISPVGNGWYRCSITFTDSMTIARVYVADANNDTSGTSGNILIQAAQLVEGTSALDYFPTTNRQDVPRIDFRNADGTLSSCGRLLLEPQRTNSIRNSSMVGAVAGSPGTLPTNWQNPVTGLTRTIVGTGTENGLPYIDFRFNGTASGPAVRIDFETNTGISALNAQSWTNSLYAKIISAPTPPTSYSLVTLERTSAGVFVTEGEQSFTPTTTLQRFSFTRTLSGGATVAVVLPGFYARFTSGVAYDFTIRIAAPQMELGAYATTWVPTTTAAVTRLADFPINSAISSFIGGTSGTWLIELDMRSTPLSGTNAVIGAAGVGKNVGLANSGNSNTFRLNVNGITDAISQNITNTFKMAISFDPSGVVCFIDGQEKSLPNTSTQILSGLTSVSFSTGTRFEYINLHQSAFFPTRLTNDQLAQLTTL